MHDKLIETINVDHLLSNVEISLIKKYFEPVILPKNRIIEEEGKIPAYLYFIVSGYLRLFHYNEQGDEITTHINCPPGFFTSYFHFSNQSISDENVSCITRCELLRITKTDLETLVEQSDAIKNYSIGVFQKSLIYNENRSQELATLRGEQRYKKLIHNFPDIIHHVPISYIASFLGMKAESLSRIRRKLNY